MTKEELFQVFMQAFKESCVVDACGDRQLRAYVDSRKQVYFLIVQEANNDWELEFWIDSYAENRIRLQEMLSERVRAKARFFAPRSYYNARGCRSRLRVTSKDEFLTDITDIRELVDAIIKKVVDDPAKCSDGSKVESVGLSIMSVEELLNLKFRIPDYQRGYCWDEQNVLAFLDDMRKWLLDHHEGDMQYRIGTIVLKEKGDTFDVIDGQQRLTTLALFAALSGKWAGGKDFILGQNNSVGSAIQKLVIARDCIRAWCGRNENGSDIDLKRITVAAVVVPSDADDLAFEFFNHLNSSGKPLSDYDLLKSHHLRYIEGDSQSKKIAERWNSLNHSIDVPELEGGNGTHSFMVCQEDLLHETLYRIRMWLRNEDFKYYADELPTHELFRSFIMDYLPLSGLCTAQKEVEIDSQLSDGFEFFCYVDKYRKLYDVFLSEKSVGYLRKYLEGHSYGTLFKAIHALSFLFFSKFGDTYLDEAIYAIAYAISRLRNEPQIRRQRISDPLFRGIAQLIRSSTHESEVLGQLLDSSRFYRMANEAPVAVSYWAALKELGDKLYSDTLAGHDYISKSMVKNINEDR